MKACVVVNICIEVSMTLYKRISMCFALFAYSTKHMTNIQIIYIIHTAKKQTNKHKPFATIH